MATSKKSTGSGGRGNAPSKAAASKGGRASGGGNKKSSGASRGGATKVTAPKKAAASKSAGGRGAVSKGASSKGAAAKKSTAGSGGRGAASKATASKKATASRGGGNSGSSRGGAATASRGRTGAASRGAQQSSNPRNDLEKLMIDGLKDIYYAEKALSKTLTRMGKSATNTELRAAFETHREETDEQIRMLEGAFAALGQKVQGKKCHAMDGLIEEGKEHMEEASKGAGRDAVMLVSAQKSEHYEIAAYGSLRTFAQSLGNNEVAQIFQQILDQEKATDEKLTGIAETVNREALASHEDTEGGEEKGGSSRGGESGGGGNGGGNDNGGGGRADVAPIPAETLDITV